MPYPKGHRSRVRGEIVSSARALFNRYGYHSVSIDQVMADAGLTRGGFYSYFANKEELYAEAITRILVEQPSENWEGVDLHGNGVIVARKIVEAYLSEQHLEDVDGTCPLIAQPNDVSRGGEILREAYEEVLRAMVGLMESQVASGNRPPREKALAIATLCVGGMVLARSVGDQSLGDDIREAAQNLALEVGGWTGNGNVK